MPESNGEVAAMIDAEVNEGGPPPLVPCDTPADVIGSRNAQPSAVETPMTIETCPAPDRILHLRLGASISGARSTTLLKSTGLELIRLVIPAGKKIPPHRASGEITVQCLEGHVAFSHDGRDIELRPGDLVYLCPKEFHSLKGLADSSVLVTLLRPRADEIPEVFPSP
jgi:quercetin dioxygenase-like cupin family protein